ncbi:ABC transporter substrate-binding protein [Marinomonas sp. C2222]|uniref:ABC transporter substrate-binding protein n=1 Tax=Marinomonas sargassi TaxID=2984494 RepID=A0ABT2YV26_9GAMM|nr:ABC transporter substrate-binding protein [Marinomonas sargassi]MCV2403751.1 ABC transporter substrate-binding protein [Marinomonas sargassi]
MPYLHSVKTFIKALLLLVICSVSYANQTFTVTDLAGRDVTFSSQPERIILGDSRYLHALSILDQEDPTKNVAAMLSRLDWVDYGSYVEYLKRFPNLKDIPIIGRSSADSFSIESAIDLRADLAIFSLDGHGPNARHANTIKILEKAGIKVIFVDFRKSPLENTPKSIALLGKVLGKEAKAQTFLNFYEAQLSKVTDKIKSLDANAPAKVFIHSRVGVKSGCCETMARGMMASFFDAAGAHNISKAVVPGIAGFMDLEYLLTNQPDLYVATAVGSKGMPKESKDDELPYVMLGAGTPNDFAEKSLYDSIKRYKLNHLEAVKSGRAHALWHGFYNSPLNVVAVQVAAKWLYPKHFSDLDPEATLEHFFNEFQAIPLTGVYWTTLSSDEYK